MFDTEPLDSDDRVSDISFKLYLIAVSVHIHTTEVLLKLNLLHFTFSLFSEKAEAESCLLLQINFDVHGTD